MRELRSILVGVDVEADSGKVATGSLLAAREAARLAKRQGARIDFIHSTWTHPEHSMAGPGSPDDARAQLADDADDLLAVLVGVAEATVRQGEVESTAQPEDLRRRRGFLLADLGRAQAARFASGEVDDGGAPAALGGDQQKPPAAQLGVVRMGREHDEVAGWIGRRGGHGSSLSDGGKRTVNGER